MMLSLLEMVRKGNEVSCSSIIFCMFIKGGVDIGVKKEVEVFCGSMHGNEEVAAGAEVKASFGQGPCRWKALE